MDTDLLSADTPIWVWRDICLEFPSVKPPPQYAQQIYAEANGVPLNRTIDLGSDVTMDFVLIPPGVARLGERCEIEFAVEKPYWISTTTVTQRQYAAVMDVNPSRFSGYDRPVEHVSWHDAMEFCRITGTSLPREWQWEYACRAWSTTRYHWGNHWDTLLANCDWDETTPVGLYPANTWGLYDMHGNVWEWCLDNWSDAIALPSSEGEQSDTQIEKDKDDPDYQDFRCIRGGSWSSNAVDCRSAYRDGYDASGRSGNCGFRVVLIGQSQ